MWTAELLGTGEYVGFIGLQHVPFEAAFTPAVELGWRLRASMWGRGLATEGARGTAAFGFDALGLTEIVAMARADNLPSVRVMQRLGMSHTTADDFDLQGPFDRPDRFTLYRLPASAYLSTVGPHSVPRRRRSYIVGGEAVTGRMIGMDASETLFEAQSALQQEADAVDAEFGLTGLLASVGEPIRVGSSALGLMVWRDLDITVKCPDLPVEPVAAIGARLAADQRVQQVLFRNDTGRWNSDPAYPDGLYLGLKCRTDAGADWKIDIWFVDRPDRQPDLTHLRTLSPRLTPETRLAILTIKSAWADRPEYGRSVQSFDIYSAVLDAHVRTVQGFGEWLASRP